MDHVKHWFRLVLIGKTLVRKIRIISHYSNNMDNVIKSIGWLANDWETTGNDNNIKNVLVCHW